MDKVPMTKAGFDALGVELKQRMGEDRQAIVNAIAEARAHGDLSENAEYHAAKEEQSLNEGRINELEDAITRAEIIDIASMSGDTVKFGATINVMEVESNSKAKYQIVGVQEANADEGKISVSSPLARALIGKECGDEVEVRAPAGSKTYEILKIEYIP